MDFAGKVVEGLSNVEWIIPHFSRFPRKRDIAVQSEDFYVQGKGFFLDMAIDRVNNKSRIFLRRSTLNLFPDTKRCTLGLKRVNGSQETIGTMTFTDNFVSCEFLLNRTRKEFENGDWLSNDKLTIICHIEEVGQKTALREVGQNTALRADRRCMSRETQTEALDSVTDKNESNEAKGARHFGTQTEPATSNPAELQRPNADRKCTSEETQTEALDSVNGKDERLDDCTCTEDKGVRLLSKNMRDLLTTENPDYDLRIFVKGKEFRAHRCILKARCPVFAMMLTHNSKEKNSGEVHIEDCDPDSFDELLVFVYTGRVENFTTSKALSLYYAADKYDFKDLKEQCVHFMNMHLSTTNVCDVALLAAKHGEKELLRMATEFFAKNMKHILLTVEWQNFMVGNPTVANELLIKSSER